MRYLPAIAWAILIFMASSLPSRALPSLSLQVSDLIIHFMVYTIFGWLLAMGFMESPRPVNWKGLVALACLGILYGASDEWHQKFVEGRFATVSDFLADSVGIVFGLTLFVAALRVWRWVKLEPLKKS